MKRINKNSIANQIAIASNIIRKNSLKIPNNYVITTPTIWNYITKGNMEANELHPYETELNKMRDAMFSPDQVLKDWNEDIKNVFYGMVLTNPFHIPYDIPETYLFIFREAISIHEYVLQTNRFGLNKEDLVTLLNTYYTKVCENKEEGKKAYHLWQILGQLIEQNLL
jgi:hypothetical protein